MHAQDRSRMLQSRAQSFGSGQASFIFHPLRRLASLAVRAAAPSAGPASPWAPPWSGAVEASSARRASSPPAAGAGAACCGGGWGCAVAVLVNSVPRLTRRLPVSGRLKNHNIILSAFVTGRWLPQKPSNYSKRWHCRILHNALGRGSMLRLWLPEVTCCCQIHSMNKTSKSGLIMIFRR